MNEETVIVLCVFAAFVLFAGNPDLMDAIIKWLGACR